MSVDLTKAKVTNRKELKEGKWVKTELIEYVDPLGQPRDWECCSRTTRVPGSECDGVGIVAVLQKSGGPELLLQKQFRPPTGGICIELPAGLLDPKESIETCAERELLEETGYIGKATRTSPIIFGDPGFCNTNMRMVHVNIDLSDERNQNPQPQLEDNEFIECFTVPLADLPNQVRKLDSEGYILDGRVANIADGIELAQAWLK